MDDKAITVQQFVEDPARYERLTMTPLPSTKYDQSNRRGRLLWQPVAPTVISVVLVVPHPQTDAVTALLRSGGSGGRARYLATCSAAADTAAEQANRCYELERYVKKLEDLVMSSARGAGTEGAAVLAMASAKGDAILERSRVNAALLERSADVAAKLLASIPDDEVDL